MHHRENALGKWLEQILASRTFILKPLTGDASFRRYFRLQHGDISRIVMDAPPDKERMHPFIATARLLDSVGVCTPRIHAFALEEGFAILDDFGDTLLLKKLSAESVDHLYAAAIDVIIRMQKAATQELPEFDNAFILNELALFREWFLGAYLQLELSAAEEQLLQQSFAWLSQEILQQPQVFIHRDYHSRNIMLLAEESADLGIIDFQDAMHGPYTYDLVSLLKDCYIQWPGEQVLRWLARFYEQAGIAKHSSLSEFTRAFDLCGLQRHLKVLGVFARLHLRDSKPAYLQDLPLTLHYVMACLESYEELGPFYQFMQNRIRLP